MGKRTLIVFGALIICAAVWWFAAAPPKELVIAPPVDMGPVPQAIMDVMAPGDPLADGITVEAPTLPGHDEIIFQPEQGRAFVTCMDGKIWRVDLANKTADPFVDPPLMPAGARQMPGDVNTLVFGSSYLHGQKYPANERVGIYKLDIPSKRITPLLLRVPILPEQYQVPQGNEGLVLAGRTFQAVKINSLGESNSRPLMFCNDLDISRDSKRIYFSEPFAYEGAAMGGATVAEAISLGHNGLLWRLDLENNTVGLVGRGYAFADGVLLEYAQGEKETSVLITQTTKFRIVRLMLSGPEAGKDHVLWKDLPGMPDGMDRDAQGRIWVGLLKKRSGLINWVHRNPWIKPLFLRIPTALLPVSKDTGILGLSADCSKALYCTMHDGKAIRDISVVVPSGGRLYLPSFDRQSRGLHSIENPLNQ